MKIKVILTESRIVKGKLRTEIPYCTRGSVIPTGYIGGGRRWRNARSR